MISNTVYNMLYNLFIGLKQAAILSHIKGAVNARWSELMFRM